MERKRYGPFPGLGAGDVALSSMSIARLLSEVRMVAPTIDGMHQALRKFLTECGRVDFAMLLFVDFISEASIEHSSKSIHR